MLLSPLIIDPAPWSVLRLLLLLLFFFLLLLPYPYPGEICPELCCTVLR